jgi:ribosomal protein S21
MANNVAVERHNNESSANVIRRFTKRVQNSGIVRRKRDNRYHTRIKSENVRQTARLKKLVKKETYELAYKLGKTTEPTKRR